LAISTQQQSLHDAKQGMHKLPQTMINVPRARMLDMDANVDIQKAVAATEATLAGRGRVLLRPSGTEPLVRVMVEGEDKLQVKTLAQALAEVVERALA